MNPENRIWCHLDYQEYPPSNEWVWASDFKTVFKAKWEYPELGIPPAKGIWRDDAGKIVSAIEWLFLGEFPDGPPPVPPPRPLCKGGIVAFMTEDEDDADSWKK
jgi:hypothetical protein